MDDLLTSYIQILLSAVDKNQKQNNGIQHQEIYEMKTV